MYISASARKPFCILILLAIYWLITISDSSSLQRLLILDTGVDERCMKAENPNGSAKAEERDDRRSAGSLSSQLAISWKLYLLDENWKIRVGQSSGSAMSLNNSYLCTLLEICTSSKREMNEALAWLMTDTTSHMQSPKKLFLKSPTSPSNEVRFYLSRDTPVHPAQKHDMRRVTNMRNGVPRWIRQNKQLCFFT